MKYKLSEQAKQEIKEIYKHGSRVWSRAQATTYQAGFKAVFKSISKFPMIGRVADEYMQGLRQYRYESHYERALLQPLLIHWQ